MGFGTTLKLYVISSLHLDFSLADVRVVDLQALQQELAYASYLNIHTAILPAPRNRSHVASYARIINNCLKNTPYLYLSVRLPIYNPTILQTQANSPVLTYAGSGLGLSPDVARAPSSLPALLVSPDLSSPTGAVSSESEMNATWEMWDVIRSVCDYNTRLTLSMSPSPFFESDVY